MLRPAPPSCVLRIRSRPAAAVRRDAAAVRCNAVTEKTGGRRNAVTKKTGVRRNAVTDKTGGRRNAVTEKTDSRLLLALRELDGEIREPSLARARPSRCGRSLLQRRSDAGEVVVPSARARRGDRVMIVALFTV